jgi:hypothetical protein
LDLFGEEHRFGGKRFKMIAHIDQHFNPLGTANSLGYLYDLIDIKQSEQESVITLKARFSKAFSALKMGGISIDLALQVGFMLHALLSRYHDVVQKFRLGRHSITDASFQTVVEQCTNYDKDPWKGPVGKDGKAPVRGNPLANTADADSGDPYEALGGKSFNYHFGHWKKVLKTKKGACMVCFGLARNPDHLTCDCPILKNLGFKLLKCSCSDTSAHKVASRMARDTSLAPAKPTTPAPAPAPPADTQPGTALVPGAFSVLTKQEYYDSGDEFDYKGKANCAMYDTGGKPNASSAYSTPSCPNVTVEPASSSKATSATASTTTFGLSMGGPTQSMGGPTASSKSGMDPKGVNPAYLPKMVLVLLKNPPSHSFVRLRGNVKQTSLLVADSGATDHMLPYKSAFIAYYPVSGRHVRMGINSFAPILGHGTAINSLNGKNILIRNCLHVPNLHSPLYNLWAHQHQRGCGFIGMYGLGMHVFFPNFIMEVNTATDCHLHYAPIGRTCGLPDLNFVQPKFLTIKSASVMATSLDHAPATIEPDDEEFDNSPTFVSHWTKHPPFPHHPPLDLSHLPPSTYTKNLKDLD